MTIQEAIIESLRRAGVPEADIELRRKYAEAMVPVGKLKTTEIRAGEEENFIEILVGLELMLKTHPEAAEHLAKTIQERVTKREGNN